MRDATDRHRARGPILREYRASFGRSVTVVAAVPALLAPIGTWTQTGAPWAGLPVTALFGSLWWIAVWRPRVRVHPGGLAIRNPLGSLWIDRAQVLVAEPGPEGLRIKRRRGRTRLAAGVLVWTWVPFRKEPCTAERAAVDLAAWVDGVADPWAN